MLVFTLNLHLMLIFALDLHQVVVDAQTLLIFNGDVLHRNYALPLFTLSDVNSRLVNQNLLIDAGDDGNHGGLRDVIGAVQFDSGCDPLRLVSLIYRDIFAVHSLSVYVLSARNLLLGYSYRD